VKVVKLVQIIHTKLTSISQHVPRKQWSHFASS